MSPKSDASASSRRASSGSPPYPSAPVRRSSNKPKSARQQFSACGACRMRRVKCDLKDLQATALDGQTISCSNCKERGLKCVDEFAQVKAVKLLRRGRRLQQVEAVYGKVHEDESQPMNILGDPSSIPLSLTPLCYIPRLKPEFFSSVFFRAFVVQRPIVDPAEFTSRYFEFTKGNSESLGPAGQLIAIILVVWAASFGIDEAGNPLESDSASVSSSFSASVSNSISASASASESQSSSASPDSTTNFNYATPENFGGGGQHGGENTHQYEVLARRKERTNEMLREVLRLIDVCGILRKPSWDGVRTLLLIWPLIVDLQSPMERLTMYESTLSQIYTLCSLAPASSVQSGQGEYIDALVRARVFWYAYVHEGITTGLRGGRLLLSEDDLLAFQASLPPLPLAPHSPSSTPHTPGSTIPTHSPPPLTRTSLTYAVHYRYSSIPIRISGSCRRVHAALTGPRARQRSEIDEGALREAWEGLETAWEELEGLKSPGVGGMGVLTPGEVVRFVNGWHIFIFECYNIIREALKQRLVSLSQSSPSNSTSGYPPTSPSIQYDRAARLHILATQKCHVAVRNVVYIIQNNVGTSFFEYDASLARDGCFFAAFLVAGEGVGDDEDVEVCLRAMREMRWAFCKSEERVGNVRLIWEGRMARSGAAGGQRGYDSQGPSQEEFRSVSAGHSPYASPPYTGAYGSDISSQHQGIQSQRQLSSSSASSSRGRLFLDGATGAPDGSSWPLQASTSGITTGSRRSHTSSPRPLSSGSSFLSNSSQHLSGGSTAHMHNPSVLAGISSSRSDAYYSRGSSDTQQIYYPVHSISQYSYAAPTSSSQTQAQISSRSSTGHQAPLLPTSAVDPGSGPGTSAAMYHQQQQNRYFDPNADPSVYNASGTNYPDVSGWQ